MGYYGTDVQLAAELIMELSVDIAPPIVVGETQKGYLKVIPITGGSFRGQELHGEIIPRGADWNTAMGSSPEDPAGVRQTFAKYTIRTHDGIVISVENDSHSGAPDKYPERPFYYS